MMGTRAGFGGAESGAGGGAAAKVVGRSAVATLRSSCFRGLCRVWWFQDGVAGQRLRWGREGLDFRRLLIAAGHWHKLARSSLLADDGGSELLPPLDEEDCIALATAISDGHHFDMARWMLQQHSTTTPPPHWAVFTDEHCLAEVCCRMDTETALSAYVVDVVEACARAEWEWGLHTLGQRVKASLVPEVQQLRDDGWFRVAFVVGTARAGAGLRWVKHFAQSTPHDRLWGYCVPEGVDVLGEACDTCSLVTAQWLTWHRDTIARRSHNRDTQEKAEYTFGNRGLRLHGLVKTKRWRGILAACYHGNLPVVEFLLREKHRVTSRSVAARLVERAVAGAQYDCVRFLCARLTVPQCSSKIAIKAAQVSACAQDSARALNTIEFLHHHDMLRCDGRLMDTAAAHGNLGLVEFLHFAHRPEGCTPTAVDHAAQRGYAAVVRFLLDHRTEGGQPWTLDRAAAGGHTEVVELLLRNHGARVDAVAESALCAAAASGSLQLVEYLLARVPSCLASDEPLTAAVRAGHVHVVQFLHCHPTTPPQLRAQRRDPNALVRAAILANRLSVVQYLVNHDCCEGIDQELLDLAQTRDDAIHQFLQARQQRRNVQGQDAISGGHRVGAS